MAYKLSLTGDSRGFLKATGDVENALGKVSDSLDDLARDTKDNADEAAKSLEREFSQAFDKVKAESKTAGDDLGRNVKRGTDEASEGTRTFKENANQNAKEVAASFDGSAQSIADGFQGLAAEAFEGFGPAGVAAGVVAAAGIGVVSKAFQDADERAQEIKDKIAELREELSDLEGDTSKLDFSTDFREWGEEMDGQTKKIDKLRQMSATLGVDEHTLYLAWTGDQDAKQKVLDATAAKQAEINDLQAKGDISDTLRQRSTALRDNLNLLGQHAGWVAEANDGLSVYNDFIGDSADKTEELTQAQQDAADASQTFSDTLTENLSVADEGLDSFVHKGKLNLKEWSDELERRSAENKRVQDFTVTIAPKLSPEAMENFAQLPIETQNEIAKAYSKGSKGDRKKIIANLEAEAKVTKVDIKPGETKGAKVEIPTTVVTTGLPKDVAEASNTAQDEANKTDNKVELKFKIDKDDLQRQVNRAAASIHPPTITVKTKIQKDTP